MLQNLVLIVKGPYIAFSACTVLHGAIGPKPSARAAHGPRRGFHRAQWVSLH